MFVFEIMFLCSLRAKQLRCIYTYKPSHMAAVCQPQLPRQTKTSQRLRKRELTHNPDPNRSATTVDS